MTEDGQLEGIIPNDGINYLYMKIAKYFFFIIIGELAFHKGIAQVRYEDMDRFSKVINEIQSKAPSFSCGNETVSFPGEAIRYSIIKNLFSYGFFSVSGGQGDESLLLNDAVDFTNVKEISFYENTRCGEYLKVYFSKSFFFEKINITTGRTGSRLSEELCFYFNKANVDDKSRLFRSVVEMIYLVKANSSTSNKTKIEEELRTWNKAVSDNHFVAYTEFAKKYPNSILTKEAKQRAEKLALSDKNIASVFKSYLARSGRSAKYLKFWGNWTPNKGIQSYAGKTKHLKDQYLKAGYKFNFDYKGEKHTYSNAGIFFEFYSYDVDVYDNAKGVDNNIIEISRKTDLVPLKVGFNDKNNVVYMAYKVRSKEDLPMYDVGEFLGLRLENDKKSSSDSYDFYTWYFDDCTILYVAEKIDNSSMVGRAKTNPTDYIKVYYHDKKAAVPSSTYKFTKDGKAYEISPRLWETLIEAYN